MDSPETLKIIEMHPIDELPGAFEKYSELIKLTPREQCETFIERFIFLLGEEDGLKKVLDIRDIFEQALKNSGGEVNPDEGEDEGQVKSEEEDLPVKKKSTLFSGGKKGSLVTFPNFFTRVGSKRKNKRSLNKKDYELELISTGFTYFLEKTKKPMPQLQRRNALNGVLSASGGITLLGYLLYHYRRPILRQYFQRRNMTVKKKVLGLQCGRELGNDEIGYQTKLLGERKIVGEALIEELILRHPLGVDEILDAGMIQFDELINPLRKNIAEYEDLVKNGTLNLVRQNAAKSELVGFRKRYAEAYHVSFSKMKKRIEKIRKLQRERVEELTTRLGGRIISRPMTLTKF